MTTEEIRIRQMTNQHLMRKAEKMTVARDLCGMQAQFMANALHSLRIRAHDVDAESFGQGLVKSWTLRGTMHVFAEDDLPLFLCCQHAGHYRRNVWDEPSFWNQRADWALTPERQAYFTQAILDALAQAPRTREELKELCRGQGMTQPEAESMFHPWGGGVREMCERGFMYYAAQEQKIFRLAPVFEPLPEADARLEIARRYFMHIAPATIRDAAYFFGATQRQVKQWLDALPVTSAVFEGKTYYWIDHGLSYDAAIPDCVFLAGFDQLMLGYEKKESLYLRQEHLRQIFNLAGIVMPGVLLHGQVAGRWKKQGGKVSVLLFDSVSHADRRIISDAAAMLWDDLTAVEFE